MTKVLFQGVYKDGTGWGEAATQLILALDSVDIDVVPRAIKLNNAQVPLHPRIKELEKKSEKGCDINIQCILPDMMDFCGDMRNIGYVFTETQTFRYTNWAAYLNNMDEVWVPSSYSQIGCEKSYVFRPVSIVNVPCDIGKYSKRYEKLEIPQLKDRFVFYFIGEYTRRKNLAGLLQAYLSEFDMRDPVALVIKTHVGGMSPTECDQRVNEMIQDIKTQLRMYGEHDNYPPVVVITQYLTDDQIMQLHATCDCFVMPSFGEGWCIPAFDAMAMGKTPIVSGNMGMFDYLFKSDSGYMCQTTSTPCFGMQLWSGHPKLYTGHDNWSAIDISELRYYMRETLENVEARNERAANGIDYSYKFTHEQVGKRMKEIIDNGAFVINDRASAIRQKHDCSKMVGGTSQLQS